MDKGNIVLNNIMNWSFATRRELRGKTRLLCMSGINKIDDNLPHASYDTSFSMISSKYISDMISGL
jgi:hypothetical protein